MPLIGQNLWHEYRERSSNFATNKAWKESVDSGERIYSALTGTGVKMIDQGRAADGNRYFQMGSEVLTAVIELQKYL